MLNDFMYQTDPNRVIKWDNLKRMYNHILDVPKELLSMEQNRKGSIHFKSHQCNTIGNIIGHCIILSEWKDVPLHPVGIINFNKWAEDFTGLDSIDDEFQFMFSHIWSSKKAFNSKRQMLLRMQYVIDNKCVPDHFYHKEDESFNLDIMPGRVNKKYYEI